MTDPTITAWSRESDLLFQLRQLREENERMAKRINDAVLAEREACAAKAEQVGQHKNHIGIAAAIRARGQA